MALPITTPPRRMAVHRRLAVVPLLVTLALCLPAPTASADQPSKLANTLAALWTKVLETPSASNPFGTGGPGFACWDLGGTVAALAPDPVPWAFPPDSGHGGGRLRGEPQRSGLLSFVDVGGLLAAPGVAAAGVVAGHPPEHLPPTRRHVGPAGRAAQGLALERGIE